MTKHFRYRISVHVMWVFFTRSRFILAAQG